MSLIEHQASTPATSAATKPAKPPRISSRLRRACDLMASGECKTITAAAERVSLSREHLSREMAKGHVQAFIATRAAQTISRGILRASSKLIELVDAESEHVAAKVSERILENAGLLKSQSHGVSVNINNNLAVGYIVDLAPKPMRTVNSTLTQDQAQDADNTR